MLCQDTHFDGSIEELETYYTDILIIINEQKSNSVFNINNSSTDLETSINRINSKYETTSH